MRTLNYRPRLRVVPLGSGSLRQELGAQKRAGFPTKYEL